MSNFIVGSDISSFQTVNWETYKNNTNFVVMKATEGVGFQDPSFLTNVVSVRETTLPHGFYHFARPDLGNTPQAEALYFISTLGTLQNGEFLALDYEVTYSDPVGWCKAFLDQVYAKCGVRPLIYLNQAIASDFDWTPVIDANYGLWIAAYTGDPASNDFNGGKWQTSVMQQWTDSQQVPGISGNVDGDVFFGDQGALMAYGYRAPNPVPVPGQVTITVPVSIAQGTAVSSPTPPSANSTTPPVVIPTPVQNNIPMNQPKPATPNFLSAFIQWLKSLFEGK